MVPTKVEGKKKDEKYSWGMSTLMSLFPLSSSTPISNDTSNDIKMYARLAEYLYILSSEIVRMRKKLNHYTEALSSSAWKKNEQFLEKFEEKNDNNLNDDERRRKRRQTVPPSATSDDDNGNSTIILGEDDDEEGEDGDDVKEEEE